MKNFIAISKAAASSYHDSKVLGKILAFGSPLCSLCCFALRNLLCVCRCPYASSPVKGKKEVAYICLQHVNEHHLETLQQGPSSNLT